MPATEFWNMLVMFNPPLFMNNANKVWLLDSGTSCHIATHESLFINLKPLNSTHYVFLPHGTGCTPKFIRSVYISPHITLQNVYLIPEFKVNLLSVSCFSILTFLLFSYIINAFCRTWILTRGWGSHSTSESIST